MNMLLKKITAVLLAVLLGTACLAGAIPAAAADGIEINEVNFPDEVFCLAVKSNIDKDKDGYLSTDEIAQAKKIFLSGWVQRGSKVKDLKGIEYLTACETLRITNLGVESIDLSALVNLKTLTAHGTNSYESLDLTKNTALETVSVWGNENLKSLRLPASVKDLQCEECSIEALILNSLSGLTRLSCYGNELTFLDVSGNPNLEFINCSNNHISELDLSGCSKLGAAASDYYIGSQQVTAKADFDSVSKNIKVPLSFANAGRLSWSAISEESPYGYDSKSRSFVFQDYNLLLDGVDYEYSTGLAEAEDMSVHITAEKDFYRVTYLTAENGDELDYQLVKTGGSVSAPALPETPEGMVCGHFNEKAENVTQDMTIYPIWTDSHSEAVTDFKNNIAVITCSVCGAARSVAFIDCLNLTSSDAGFEPLLDVNADGIINARDLAELTKQFK